jgi:tetratricopeptide (TPR) repeat protein
MNAYGDAIRCASRGIREARKAGDLLHVVAGQRLIAAAQKSTGEYSEAEQNLNAALLISELQAVHLEKARILLLMGWLHHDQATLRNEISGEARNLFQQALDAARHVHDLFCAVEAEISLCWQDLSAKETVHAGAYLESLKRALSPELHPQLRAGIEVAAAAEAHQKGDLPEAARMYDKAIAFCAAHECNAWKRRALIGLGATHWHRGNTAEAEQFWDEALKLAERSSKAKRELAAAIIGVCRRDRSEIPR